MPPPCSPVPGPKSRECETISALFGPPGDDQRQAGDADPAKTMRFFRATRRRRRSACPGRWQGPLRARARKVVVSGGGFSGGSSRRVFLVESGMERKTGVAAYTRGRAVARGKLVRVTPPGPATSVLRSTPTPVCNPPKFPMNKDILLKAANEARGLAMDAVHTCSSGHLGLPLGAAEIGAVLFGQRSAMRSRRPEVAEPRPLHPLRRARLDVPLRLAASRGLRPADRAGEELPRARTAHARAIRNFTKPPGVEAPPARSARASATRSAMRSAARWRRRNTTRPTHTIFDNHVVALAGDGCLQEGVAREAVAFAGAQRARQSDPHLRLQRRDARRDGQAHAERGHGKASSRRSAGTW